MPRSRHASKAAEGELDARGDDRCWRRGPLEQLERHSRGLPRSTSDDPAIEPREPSGPWRSIAATKAVSRSMPLVSLREPAMSAMRRCPCSTRWSTSSSIPAALSRTTRPAPAPSIELSKNTHGTRPPTIARRTAPGRAPTVETSRPSTRWAISVRSAATSPFRRLLAVHQHHAVAGFVQRRLGALQRRGVERARDVGDDEADSVRRSRAQRAGERATAGTGALSAASRTAARVRSDSSPRPFKAREAVDAETPADAARRRRACGRDLTVRQTIAQAIATLT